MANSAAVVAAGAIAPCVRLLEPGSTSAVHQNAASLLTFLARNAAASIGSAGAILVRLLGPGSTPGTQAMAAGALAGLADFDGNTVTIITPAGA